MALVSVHAQHRPRRRFGIGPKRCEADGQSWPCSKTSTVERRTPPEPEQPIGAITLEHRAGRDQYVVHCPGLYRPRLLPPGEVNPSLAAELIARECGHDRIGPWRLAGDSRWRADLYA